MYGSICISMSTSQHHERADTLAETQLDDWNNWYVLKVEKRGWPIKHLHRHGKQDTHNAHIHPKLAGWVSPHFVHLHNSDAVD
jgi:hypothetical protein